MFSKFKLWLALVALVSALGGCVTAPLKEAETIEQRAYAAYGTFVILEEQVVILTSAGSALPRNQQLAMISAVERAQPTVASLLEALQEYRAARGEFEAERMTKSAFEAIVSNLDQWATRAGPVLASLRSSVR